MGVPLLRGVRWRTSTLGKTYPKKEDLDSHYLRTKIFFFRLNALKSTAKALAVDFFRLITLRVRTKTALFTPERYNEQT